MKDVKFVNAVEMSIQHPGSFEVPEEKDIKSLKPGNLVKVCAFNERFWVEITEIKGNTLIGRVDNELLTDAIKLNDTVSFKDENIYQIFK